MNSSQCSFMETLLSNAPLRFELPGGTESTTSFKAPAGAHYFIPYANHVFTEWPGGSYFEQSVFQQGFGFCLLHFVVEKSISFGVEAMADFNTLQFTLEGETTALLSGHGFMTLSEGTYTSMYIPQGSHRVWFRPGQYAFFYLILSGEHLQLLQEDHPHLQTLITNILTASKEGVMLERMVISTTIHTLINKVIELKLTGAQLKLALEEFVVKFVQAYNHDILQRKEIGREMPPEEYADFIKVYVMDNVTMLEATNINNLKKMFYTSERTLERYFKRRSTQSLRSYLRRLRLERALYMLLPGDLSIQDVAVQLGYKDAYTFSRQFSKYYGYSPKNAAKVFCNFK